MQTALATRDKLKKYNVDGNTNMYDAFEEAFRYRKMGLDTIYLFSDGLPTVGDGLPANLRAPSEAELSFHLGKHVRNKLKIGESDDEGRKQKPPLYPVGWGWNSGGRAGNITEFEIF